MGQQKSPVSPPVAEPTASPAASPTSGPSAGPTPADTPNLKPVAFTVGVQDAVKSPKALASGLVISDGVILTSSAIVDGRKDIFVRFEGAAQPLPSTVIATDFDLGLSLLRVPAAPKAAMATLAAEDPGEGVAIRALFSTGGTVQEKPGAISRAAYKGQLRFWQHNALIGSTGYGGGLVNECGELVGVDVVNPFGGPSKARALPAPKDVVYSVNRTSTRAFLEKWSITPQIAATACKSAAEKASEAKAEAAEAQKSASTAQDKLKLAEADAAKAQKTAEDARREAELRRKEAERVLADSKSTDEQKKAAEKAAEEAQAQAEKAGLEAAKQSNDMETLRKQVAKLDGEVAAGKQTNVYIFGAAAAAVLLVALGLGLLLVGRGKKLKHARAGLSSAEAKLAQTFPDIEFRGRDSSGAPHAFKLLGSALVRSSDGVIVGRQPQASNIVLNHPEISREHARFKLTADGIAVEDLNSTNGTKVNGRRLQLGEVIQLRSQDELALGSIVLNVRFLDA